MAEPELARRELLELMRSDEGKELLRWSSGVLDQAQTFQTVVDTLTSTIESTDNFRLSIGAFGLEIQEVEDKLRAPLRLYDKMLEIGRRHGVVEW